MSQQPITKEQDFFREATIRICGSLEAETFLWESFQFIQQYIPADKIALVYYDQERNQHVVLAIVSSTGAQSFGFGNSLAGIGSKIPSKGKWPVGSDF